MAAPPQNALVVGLRPARAGPRRALLLAPRRPRGRDRRAAAPRSSTARRPRSARPGAAPGAAAATTRATSRTPTWWCCRPACRSTLPLLDAARARGVPVVCRARAGRRPVGPRAVADHRHERQEHDHRAGGRDARGRRQGRGRLRQHRPAARRRGAGATAARAGRVEISSFQLETDLRAARRGGDPAQRRSADHLDRHGGFEAYRAAKPRGRRPARRPTPLVLTADDPELAPLAAAPGRRVLQVSALRRVTAGGFVERGELRLAVGGARARRSPASPSCCSRAATTWSTRWPRRSRCAPPASRSSRCAARPLAFTRAAAPAAGGRAGARRALRRRLEGDQRRGGARGARRDARDAGAGGADLHAARRARQGLRLPAAAPPRSPRHGGIPVTFGEAGPRIADALDAARGRARSGAARSRTPSPTPRRSPARATSCCSRPPARRSTVHRLRRAGRRLRRRRAGAAPRRPPREPRPVARYRRPGARCRSSRARARAAARRRADVGLRPGLHRGGPRRRAARPLQLRRAPRRSGCSSLVLAVVVDYHRLARPGTIWALLIGGLGAARRGAARAGDRQHPPLALARRLRFQPSELAKPVLVLALAAALLRTGPELRTAHGLLPGRSGSRPGSALLVLARPGPRHAGLLFGTTLALVIAAGARWRHVAALVAAGLALFAVFALIEPYRVARLAGFTSAVSSTRTGWATSPTSCSSRSSRSAPAGSFGRGFGAATQKALLPARGRTPTSSSR